MKFSTVEKAYTCIIRTIINHSHGSTQEEHATIGYIQTPFLGVGILEVIGKDARVLKQLKREEMSEME